MLTATNFLTILTQTKDMIDTKYVISIPLDEEESEELGFPDLENMFRFMEILLEKGLDIDQIIIPEGSLI